MAVKEITPASAPTPAPADDFDAEFKRLMSEEVAPGSKAADPPKEPESKPESKPADPPKEPESKPESKPADPPKEPESKVEPGAKQESKPADPPKDPEPKVEPEAKELTADEILAQAGILPPKRAEDLEAKLKSLRERDPELVDPLLQFFAAELDEIRFNTARAVVDLDVRHQKELRPVSKKVAESARREEIATVDGLAADKAAVEAWIKAQPKLVRSTFENVYARGTVEEVRELYGIFKQSQPSKPEQRPAAGTEGSEPTPNPEPAKKPTGAEHLTSVPSKRATPNVDTAGPDKSDFKGGWEEAARLEAEGRAL